MSPSRLYSRPFINEDITRAIKNMKFGKAPGFYGIHPEFLVYCGKYAREWLAYFYTNILQST